jgi:hypothetical protein
MMEAASTSETSVNFYQTAWRNNPEDSHLHTRRRKTSNLTKPLDYLEDREKQRISYAESSGSVS